MEVGVEIHILFESFFKDAIQVQSWDSDLQKDCVQECFKFNAGVNQESVKIGAFDERLHEDRIDLYGPFNSREREERVQVDRGQASLCQVCIKGRGAGEAYLLNQSVQGYGFREAQSLQESVEGYGFDRVVCKQERIQRYRACSDEAKDSVQLYRFWV